MAADRNPGGEVHWQQDGDVAFITLDNPPVNASTDAIRRGILAALSKVDATRTRAVVLQGHGEHLMAGADLRELEKEPTEPTLPQVTAALEACPVPVIAVISGHTLGGGLELALACDVRLATPSASLGLPEVTVGVIPGAGGTQRLPRAVGLAKALDMIVSGRPISAANALELGLVDQLLDNDGTSRHADVLAFARAYADGKQPLRQRTVAPADLSALKAQAQKLLGRSRGLPAAAVAAEVVLHAATMDFDTAIAAERSQFLALRGSEAAQALRYLFFAERAQPFTPSKPLQVDAPKQVAVIGAGTMGRAIALCLLQGGCQVTMVEMNPTALAAGKAWIHSELESSVERQRLSANEKDEMLTRLHSDESLDAVSGTDLVIEAIIEDLAAKRALFNDLAKRVSDNTLLATNTSYLDIEQIAEGVNNPQRVLGLHFFSPAHRMALLEVVRTQATREHALSAALKLARRLRKQAIVVANAWGFVGNRLYAAYRRQCEFMLEEGASPEQIDAAIEAYGFAMGPFKVADLSGLDIAWRMRQQNADSRHLRRYVGIPDRLCEAQRFGRKTGAGYYHYGDDQRPKADPEVARLIDDYRTEHGIEPQSFSAETIQKRALMALINEALLLLSEGVCQRPEDIDIALVHGYGFPRWRGGPVFIARQMGSEALQQALDQLAQASGKGHQSGDPTQLTFNPVNE